MLFCRLLIVLKIKAFKKLKEYHWSVKQFGSRSGQTFYWMCPGFKMFAFQANGRGRALADKELNHRLHQQQTMIRIEQF